MPDDTIMMPLCMCSNFEVCVDGCMVEVDMKLYTHVNEMVEHLGVRGTAAAFVKAHRIFENSGEQNDYGIADAMHLPIMTAAQIKRKVFGSASQP